MNDTWFWVIALGGMLLYLVIYTNFINEVVKFFAMIKKRKDSVKKEIDKLKQNDKEEKQHDKSPKD